MPISIYGQSIQEIHRSVREKTMETTSSTQSWENLTFANNFLFCKIMESEPELCRQLLELLLHVKIDHLETPQAERTMQEWIDAKSVRFDVYTKDDKRIFDVEVQTSNNKNLPKRSRYYQSVIDMDNLSKGENYTKLKDSYIIFLCLEDAFGKGLPVYFFENTCKCAPPRRAAVKQRQQLVCCRVSI